MAPSAATAAAIESQASDIALAMLALPVAFNKIDRFPDPEFLKKSEDLLTNLVNLKQFLPDDGTGGEGSCTPPLKFRRRELSRRGPLRSLFHVISCAILPVQRVVDGQIHPPGGNMPNKAALLADVTAVGSAGGKIQEHQKEQEAEEQEEEEEEEKEKEEEEQEEEKTNSISKEEKTRPTTTSMPTRISPSTSSTPSLVSSTASLSGHSRYIIKPTSGALVDQISSVSSRLLSVLGTTNVAVMSMDETFTVFAAKMPASFAAELAQSTNAPHVELDKDYEDFAAHSGNAQASPTVLYKRSPRTQFNNLTGEDDEARVLGRRDATVEIVRDKEAPVEVNFVSTPRGQDAYDSEGYTWRRYARDGINRESWVYVIDTGANIYNPELSSMPGGMEWVFHGDPYWDNFYGFDWKTQTDEENHGTGVISKVAGVRFGIYKEAHIVVVKQICPRGSRGVHRWYFAQTLRMVRRDIEDKGRVGRAVINISMALATTALPDLDWVSHVARGISSLLLAGIPLITGTNNEGASQVVDIPAVFHRQMPDMIVVGGVDVNGVRAPFSAWDMYTDIGAPAFIGVNPEGNYWGLKVADAVGDDWDAWMETYGVSFASPAVAGLAAHFLAHRSDLHDPVKVDETPAKFKQHIQDLGYYRRHRRSRRAIWNGLSSPPKPGCGPATAARKRKRQDADYEGAEDPPAACPLKFNDRPKPGDDLPLPNILPCATCDNLVDGLPLASNNSQGASAPSASVSTSPPSNIAALLSTRIFPNGPQRGFSLTSIPPDPTSTKQSPVATSAPPSEPPPPPPPQKPTITDPTTCSATFRSWYPEQTHHTLPPTSAVQSAIDDFCKPPEGPIIVQRPGEAEAPFMGFDFPNDESRIFQLMFEWEDSEECRKKEAPRFDVARGQKGQPDGPDYWCWKNFRNLLEKCLEWGGEALDEGACVRYGIQGFSIGEGA